MGIKVLMVAGMLVVLAGCKPAVETVPLPVPASSPPTALVRDLRGDPARLEEVRRLCREDRIQVTDELCIAATLAAREQFMGKRRAQYTTVELPLPVKTEE